MSVKFEWEDKYTVGNVKLDNQHQYLFRLGNEIKNADTHEGKRYVMELFKYTKAHFGSEEEHTTMHNELITDLSAVA